MRRGGGRKSTIAAKGAVERLICFGDLLPAPALRAIFRAGDRACVLGVVRVAFRGRNAASQRSRGAGERSGRIRGGQPARLQHTLTAELYDHYLLPVARCRPFVQSVLKPSLRPSVHPLSCPLSHT